MQYYFTFIGKKINSKAKAGYCSTIADSETPKQAFKKVCENYSVSGKLKLNGMPFYPSLETV